MAGLKQDDKQHFPLKNVETVVDLFRKHLLSKDEPDLVFWSIVLGYIENVMTVNKTDINRKQNHKNENLDIHSEISLDDVHALYTHFVTYIRGSVDLTRFPSGYATRELIRFVLDVIWFKLARGNTYQGPDKDHLQSLYSYLTGKTLALHKALQLI